MRQRLLVKKENEFNYDICFENSFDHLSEEMIRLGYKDRNICIVTDSCVSKLYLNDVKQALKEVSSRIYFFEFPFGEANKNLDTISDLYLKLIEWGFDRKSVLVALGGGVTGDMTGFAAATYLRGIDFVQIPTTLLAQVDSSVGGKTGVDFKQYKNMIGAFHQPKLVYMNLSTLKTLPMIQFSCGMGEIVKTGLICDYDFFTYLENNSNTILSGDFEALSYMVKRCCEIKASVVERDPKEKGERALLNLGHTIGHAVEKLMNFQLLHGQCVGLGLIAAAIISENRGLLTSEETARITKTCISFGLPEYAEGISAQEIVDATKKDKKMDNGHIRFILMNGLGQSFIATDVTDEEMMNASNQIIHQK
ncbi:MAG: 3-dehydroquinate synthase [Eubacteriales bacterium]|nr:3-dehydroquinate synthase [Eubacteriales bacterium]